MCLLAIRVSFSGEDCSNFCLFSKLDCFLIMICSYNLDKVSGYKYMLQIFYSIMWPLELSFL